MEHLPRWSVRLNASRPSGHFGFSDLMSTLASHYHLHVQLENFLGPFNAKQRSGQSVYFPPTKEQLRAIIKQGRVNDFSYQACLGSVVRFCEMTKGNRALPTPHPSTIHSIQLPLPAFSLTSAGSGDTMIQVMGVEVPLLVKGLRQADEVKFIIIRPRLSQLGTASAKDWEVLFYRDNPGYIPDWVDTNLNPRYSGILG